MSKTRTETSEAGLVRGIRRWDLVAITINGIIGGGIFGLPAVVFGKINSYSLIAFVVCALVVALIILCFAEVGSRFDQTGGPYLYAREAFGPTTAFEIGWLIWLARLTAFAANANLLVSYLSYFFPPAINPGWRAFIIIAIVIVIAAINVLGVRQAAIVSNFFTIGKLIPLLLIIGVGLFFLNREAFALGPPPAANVFGVSIAPDLCVHRVRDGNDSSGRNTRSNGVCRALLIAIAVVAFVYILIQVVSVGTLPGLAQSQKPLADAGARFMGTAGGAIISAGAVISIVGNLNILVLSGSRIPFAIAEQQQLPSFIAKVHRRFATPYVAILITAGLMLLFTLKSSFSQALTISAIARLVTYGATCLSLPVLRRRTDAPPAAFRLRAGNVVAGLSLLLILWLLTSAQKEALTAAIAAAVGFLIYFAYKLYSGRSN